MQTLGLPHWWRGRLQSVQSTCFNKCRWLFACYFSDFSSRSQKFCAIFVWEHGHIYHITQGLDPDFPLDATRVLLSCRGQCSQCNLGYYLDSDTEKCTPWPCRDAVPQFSAPFPRRFLQNHRNFHQAFLPSPLLLSLKCLVSLSQEGHGAGCKACKAQIDRTAIDQCQECNPGYQLHADGSCHPFKCTEVGLGHPCKACRKQADRRADNQCAECNVGFRLGPETFMCIPHRCNEGPGSACKSCASSKEATHDGECLEP